SWRGKTPLTNEENIGADKLSRLLKCLKISTVRLRAVFCVSSQCRGYDVRAGSRRGFSLFWGSAVCHEENAFCVRSLNKVSQGGAIWTVTEGCIRAHNCSASLGYCAH